MTTNTKNRTEHIIYQKRIQADKLSNLQTKLRQQFHEKQFARWENKGNDVLRTKEIKQRLQDLRNHSQQNINNRRQQLTDLLEKEQFEYQKEIVDSQETPEQIRARMAERVKQLKEERENERKEYVNEKLYKRFELNADQLRKVDAEIRELKTDYERNIQLIQKQNILANQYEQQVLFAELNRRELKKNQEKQREKLKQSKQKQEERNAILAIQKEMKQQKLKQQKVMGEAEKQMLREEWQQQLRSRALKEQEIVAKSKQIAKQLIIANQKQKREKQELVRLEKQNDKELIQRILEKQKQVIQFQKDMKHKQRQEARKIFAGLKSKNQQMENYEKELDKLIQAERIKKQRKAQQQYEKSEEGRIKLLYDVYNDRERKVHEHNKIKQQEKRIKQQEKIQLQEKVKKQLELEDLSRQKEFQKHKNEQRKLVDQIRAKQEKRKNILLEIQRQQDEIVRARQDYEQKIIQRKEKGKQELDQFKRTNRIF